MINYQPNIIIEGASGPEWDEDTWPSTELGNASDRPSFRGLGSRDGYATKTLPGGLFDEDSETEDEGDWKGS